MPHLQFLQYTNWLTALTYNTAIIILDMFCKDRKRIVLKWNDKQKLDRKWENFIDVDYNEFSKIFLYEKKRLTLAVSTPTAHQCYAMLCDDRLPYLLILQNRCPDLDRPIEPIDEIPTSELLRVSFSIQMMAETKKKRKIVRKRFHLKSVALWNALWYANATSILSFEFVTKKEKKEYRRIESILF